jgi:hypothetical protein
MADVKIFKPKEINTSNIIGSSFVDLSKDQRHVFEVLKKKRQEEFEVLRKRQEEKDFEVFLPSLRKDW